MKTAISLPDDLFARIDRTAAEVGMSRSAFLAAAAESYLRARERDNLTVAIDAALELAGDPAEAWVLDAGFERLADERW